MNKEISIEGYKQLTKGMTPSVENFVEVKSTMFYVDKTGDETVKADTLKSLMSCIEAFVEEEYFAIDNAVTQNGKTFDAFTQDELKWYVMYCILQRVLWVRNEGPEFRPQDPLWFPSIIAVICQNIGIVSADREGVIITPDIDEDVKAQIKLNMTKERAQVISRYLEKSVPGYQGAKGYVKSKEGCADFMLMQVLADEVKSPRHDSHPVYALLASFVGVKLVDSSILPTQKYAETKYLKVLMSEVTSC